MGALSLRIKSSDNRRTAK